MALFIVKWSDNWADEMDLEGFDVFEAASAEEAIAAAAGRFFDNPEVNGFREYDRGVGMGYRTFSCGTNEEIEYDNAVELSERMTAVEAAPEEVAVLRRLVSVPYGFFPGS